MKIRKLIAYILIVFCFVCAKDVYADTGWNCRLLDESKRKDQILSVNVNNSSYTEYKPGDKFYVNVNSGLSIKKTDEVAVILKPTINTNNHVLTAYIKNINTRNEETGEAYFIIPKDAVVGEEYEIWGYNFYRQTTDVQEYAEFADGSKQPIYYVDCAFYVTNEGNANQDEWNRSYIYNSSYKIKIVEDYREVKDVLKTVTLNEQTAYFGGTFTFNVTTSEPVSRIVLGFNTDESTDGHNYGHFESYMFYNSNATSYSAEVDVPTYGVNYVYPGTYKLNTVMLYYKDGTYTRYSTNKAFADSERETQYFESDLKVTLSERQSNMVAEGAFELVDFRLESNAAEIGGKLPVRYNFAFDSASQELKTVLLTFYDKTNNTMFSSYVKSILHDSYIVIPSIAKPGNYVLKSAVISLETYGGEPIQVIATGDYYKEIFSQTVNITEQSGAKEGTNILVFSAEDLNSEIYQIIEESKDSSIITIHADNSKIIPAELFEAIKETTKQLIIEVNGTEWVFNGTDIEEIKPLNVSLDISDLDQANIPASIKGNFGFDGLAIGFPNNGKLPGKALIRLKDESIFNRLGLGNVEKYYIYYLDDNGNRLNRVASEVQKSYNGYIEFYINHNSTYIITAEEITDTELLGEDEEIFKVNSPDAAKVSEDKESTDNTMLYVIIGVSAVVLVGIVALLVSSKKKTNKIKETEKEIEEAKKEEKVEEKEPEENEK